MYNCDIQDWWVPRRHVQWSDSHVASTTEKVLVERENGELDVLTITAVRTNPEVQGLAVVAQDTGDEQAPAAASAS